MTDVIELPQPESMTRMETGPVRFGDDWTGVFIRGDNALFFANAVEIVTRNYDLNFIEKAILERLARTLKSCLENG